MTITIDRPTALGSPDDDDPQHRRRVEAVMYLRSDDEHETTLDGARIDGRTPTVDEVLATLGEIHHLAAAVDDVADPTFREQLSAEDARRLVPVLHTLNGLENLITQAKTGSSQPGARFLEDVAWPAHYLMTGAAAYLTQDWPAAVIATADKEDLAVLDHARALTTELAEMLGKLSGPAS